MSSALQEKLDQAAFHLDRMREVVGRDFEMRCYFAAYLSSVRSVTLYVRTWLEQEGKIKKGDGAAWRKKIEPWEAVLPRPNALRWAFITRLRNTDIHDEPAIPTEDERGGFFARGWFAKGYFANGWFSGSRQYTITHQASGETFELFEACETSLRVARQLIEQYQGL